MTLTELQCLQNILYLHYYVKRNSKLSIQDYWKEQTDYWYPKLIEGKDPKYLDVMSHLVDIENFPYDKTNKQ